MHNYSLEDVIEARNKCAAIIALYGKAYLPLFERLEKEIKELENEQELYKKAMAINGENATLNVTPFATLGSGAGITEN